MKKIKIMILATVSVLVLTGCGAQNDKDNNNSLEHKWSNVYSNSATRHWYDCEDEGCTEKKSEEYHEWGQWEIVSYATQEGNQWNPTIIPGIKERYCEVCGYKQTEEHSYKEGDEIHQCDISPEWSYDENYHWKECSGTIEVSGQWGGSTTEPCDRKEFYEEHEWTSWVIDNYAIIQHDAAGQDDVIVTIGNKHRTCKICNYVNSVTHNEEAPLAEHEHHFDDVWQSNEDTHWNQCDFGKTVGYGGRDLYPCSEKKNEASHTWDAGVVTKQPTTSSEGIKTFTCSICKRTKTETISPIIDNTDGSEIISVNFNKLQGKQAATVNPKTKAYIDAMKNAEKSLADPYKMQDLKNGVDVEKYLSKEDYKDSAGQGHNKPDGVTLTWNKGTMDYTNAIIKYSLNADMSDALEVSTSTNSVKINNLLSNAKYFYQLTYTKGTTLYKSNIETFETADYTRFIDMGLVYNVRDMGNYQTSYGGRVKQGLIYRGSELTPKEFKDGNGTHPKNIDDEVLQLQKSVLKIKVEVDHRSAGEANNISTSPLNTSEIPVEYKREGYKVSAYQNFLNADNTAIQNIYKAFADADTKHVYFHCIGGADRTGCAAFVLLGLLGVSYTDAIIDFEVTTATNYPRSRFYNHPEAPYYSQFPNFYNAFVGSRWYSASKSFKDNCEAFLKSKGVTDATIEKIRSTMIEGYKK